MTLLITLIIAAITYGTPLLFGTLGEILTEKSGNLNLGVEGIMFMGGALGLGGVYYYEKLSSSPNGFVAILVGIFFAFLAGAIASLIFSFLTITLRANQNVTGLDFSTDVNDAGFVETVDLVFAQIRNIARNFFAAEFGITGLNRKLFNVDGRITVISNHFFAHHHRVFVVVSVPRHEGNDHILT